MIPMELGTLSRLKGAHDQVAVGETLRSKGLPPGCDRYDGGRFGHEREAAGSGINSQAMASRSHKKEPEAYPVG